MKDLPSYRSIWKIAWPIILTLLAQNLINVTDTAFLGRVGEVELGASAIAGLFYIVLFMLGFGFAIGGQILIARRLGERNYREIGRIFDHSLLFLLALAVVLFFTIKLLAPLALRVMIQSPQVYQATQDYLRYRIWGIFFAFPAVLFRAYYTGIARTKYLSWTAALMAVVNILFDYLLIFGHWIFPAMGIAGAAIASVISETVAFVFFVLISLTPTNLHKYQIFRFKAPQWALLQKTLEISVFIMMQYFVSLAGWFMFFMIIEKMGEHPLAVSNIIRSAYMVLMLPIWAFSSAANTLVSRSIGAGQKHLVIPVIKRIAGMSFTLIFAVVLFSICFPELILSVYTSDPQLIASTLPSLYVISGALLLFSVVQIIFSAVSGTANTNMALLIETLTIAIYLLYVYLVALVWQQPIEVVWSSEYVYFVLLGTLSALYLKTGRWRKKEV
ncbi:MAG TPA: MATE family efflux transporter [Bacteroidales bacterium]|nr:MATE family efflux transporter [Bacteroidales bacterium]HSA42177.1 MATE family efflux transporter [Bacteroidales bacterium]